MDRYRSKSTIVEAWQYQGFESYGMTERRPELLRGAKWWENDANRHVPMIDNGTGFTGDVLRPGDWVVIADDGLVTRLFDARMKARYELLGDDMDWATLSPDLRRVVTDELDDRIETSRQDADLCKSRGMIGAAMRATTKANVLEIAKSMLVMLVPKPVVTELPKL